MNIVPIMLALYIAIAAVLGAWSRWGLSLLLNPLFPNLPLGTLVINLTGGFLMGILMAITRYHHWIPATLHMTLTAGFLSSFTTFSAFSAETVLLLSAQSYLSAAILIIAHVAGTILATILGIFTVKSLGLF
jgi:CrcB protein